MLETETTSKAGAQVETKQVGDSAQNRLDSLKRELSLWFAAGVIARQRFPENLPPISKTPFESLGHQVLIDYDLVIDIIWGLVDSISIVHKKHRRKSRVRHAVIAGIAVILGIAAGVLGGGEAPLAGPIVSVVVWVLVQIIAAAITGDAFAKETLKIRSEAIGALLSGKLPSGLPGPLRTRSDDTKQLLSKWDDGGLDPSNALVVLSDHGQRFPGLGTEQFRQTFLFPPGSDAKPLSDAFLTSMEESLSEFCERTGAVVERGYVLGANKDVIRWKSDLILRDLVPRLRIDLARARGLSGQGEHESCRLYSCYRLTFPHLHTSISFLLRSFQAAGSAACELALVTLGPPSWTRAWIEQRATELMRAASDDAQTSINHAREISRQKRIRWADVIRSGHVAAEPGTERRSAHIDWQDLKPVDKDQYEDLDAAVSERVKNTVYWSMLLGEQTNPWRKKHSRSFSSDPFVSQELAAMARSIYEQAMRAMLERVEDAGYDVTAYRDSNGRLNISADKIDSLIIGTTVSVGHSDGGSDDSKDTTKDTKSKSAE